MIVIHLLSYLTTDKVAIAWSILTKPNPPPKPPTPFFTTKSTLVLNCLRTNFIKSGIYQIQWVWSNIASVLI